MKYVSVIIVLLLLVGCKESEDAKAAAALLQIRSLYEDGKYSEALDSIMSLREHHPTAIEARKQALKIWQDASLKMAQNDIARTDSSLHATLEAIKVEQNLYKANMLRVKRDSLQARYEAMCGVVRMIHARQKERKN